jgi:hypothetical protein
LATAAEKHLTAKAAKKSREGRKEELEIRTIQSGQKGFFANFAVKSFLPSRH